jgi:hypothetical protein
VLPVPRNLLKYPCPLARSRPPDAGPGRRALAVSCIIAEAFLKVGRNDISPHGGREVSAGGQGSQLTLSGIADDLSSPDALSAPDTWTPAAPTRIAGQPVLAVQAQPAAAEAGVAATRHFSHWHEPVSLTAPAPAVPAAQVPSSFPKSS